MENFLFKLDEVNPRSVYKDSEGILIIKGKSSKLNSSKTFKKKYNKFIFDHDDNALISWARAVFSRFYGQSYSINPPLVVNLFKFLFMPAPGITKYGKILDVGCSTGEFLNNLPGDWQKTGIEINEMASRLAQKKGLKVRNCSLEDYKTTEKFDVIRACHVLEHFDNYDSFFGKVSKLLKKNGLLVIYTPNSKAVSFILTKSNWSYLYEKTHFLIFNIDNLSKIAKRHNLRLISSGTYYMGDLIDSLLRMIKIQNPKTKNILYYLFSMVFFPFSFIDKVFMKGDSLMAVFKK